MARRIMIETADGDRRILAESEADDELQLQELIKEKPELVPVEDLNMTGPLAVIGRETRLPSGAVDLVAVSREGHLLIMEFKTGPQNADFRAALAQLVDYGSDMWQWDWTTFEREVPLSYFASDRCHDPALAKCGSLSEALASNWPDLDDEEFENLQTNLAAQLEDGSFHYVLLAQRFTPPILQTIEYLNEVSRPRFYAAEVVRFTSAGTQAFEGRVIQGPPRRRRGALPVQRPPTISKTDLLARFPENEYGDAIGSFVENLEDNGFVLQPGRTGASVRRHLAGLGVTVTVAWLGPPGQRVGPGGRDLTLGTWARPKGIPEPVTRALEQLYSENGAHLGTFGAISKNANGIHIEPEAFVAQQGEIIGFMSLLVRELDALNI